MKKRYLAIGVILLAFTLILSGCGGGSGQGNSGSSNRNVAQLTVVVKDPSGSPLSGASVSIGPSVKKMTDSDGIAVFDSLKPGDYTVKVEKDGYRSVSKDYKLETGDKMKIDIALEKMEEAGIDKLNEVSKLKSYKAVIEIKGVNDKNSSKIIMVQDNYGKEQHITVYNDKGEVELELYVVGDKAKIKSGKNGKWMEMPAQSASALAKASISFAENLMNDTVEYYNESVKGANYEYVFKKVGAETVNGYPTYKYHAVIKGGYGDQKGSLVGDIWVISRGPYKGYTTRISLNMQSSGTNENASFVANLTDIGKDMHITLP